MGASVRPPVLLLDELAPTRDRLRDAALVLGKLQQVFLPKHPRDWQRGLEVTMRGLSTQAFEVEDEKLHASLDLVSRKVRLDGNKWPLEEYGGPELFNEIQVWLRARGVEAELEKPEFSGSRQFVAAQSDAYAQALWWLEERFRLVKAGLAEGTASPILVYPHHFDLSLVWFPFDDERQLGLGFSTGDETIAEPYLYLTTYPEPAGFKAIKLPDGAYWQADGFSGAILPYAVLQANNHPEELFKKFAGGVFAAARPLFG